LAVDHIETVLENLELLKLHFAEIIVGPPIVGVHLPPGQGARRESTGIVRPRVVQIAQFEISFESRSRFLSVLSFGLQADDDWRLPFHPLNLLDPLVLLFLVRLPAVDRRDLDAGGLHDGTLSKIATATARGASLDESAGQLESAVAGVALHQPELHVVARSVEPIEAVADQR